MDIHAAVPVGTACASTTRRCKRQPLQLRPELWFSLIYCTIINSTAPIALRNSNIVASQGVSRNLTVWRTPHQFLRNGRARVGLWEITGRDWGNSGWAASDGRPGEGGFVRSVRCFAAGAGQHTAATSKCLTTANTRNKGAIQQGGL